MTERTHKSKQQQQTNTSNTQSKTPTSNLGAILKSGVMLNEDAVMQLQRKLGNTVTRQLVVQRQDGEEEETQTGWGGFVDTMWSSMFGSEPTEEEKAEAQPDENSPVRDFPDVTGRCITPQFAASLDTQGIQDRMDVLRREMNEIGTEDPLYRSHSANIYILENEFVKRGQESARELSDEDLQAQVDQLREQKESMGEGDARYQTTSSTLRVMEAELARRGRSEEMEDQIEQLADATGQDQHRALSETLVDYVREQIEIFPDMVETFIQQPEPSRDEKVRILGELVARVARTEYLLGTIYYEGSGDWEETSNQGEIVSHYNGSSTGPWCTKFATTVREMALGGTRVVAGSGYKVANPSEFTDSDGDASFDYDYSDEYGGAFVGITRGTASTNENSRRYSEFAGHREDLNDAPEETDDEDVQTRDDMTQSFLNGTITPQAGDIMIVKRGSADDNSFSGGQSHTTTVERFEGTTIYTIEGNTGAGTDEVIGKAYDLSDPDDVAKIVYIARPSLASGRDESVDGAIGTQGEEASTQQITESDLMMPVDDINNMLEEFADAQEWIESPDAGELDVVANMD